MPSLMERDSLSSRKNPRDGNELIINMTSVSVTTNVNPLSDILTNYKRSIV